MYILQANSATQVELEPEFNFERSDSKIENEHRTRDGSRFVYYWGSFTRFKFGVRFVDSATMGMINGWWLNNTALQFYEDGSSDVFSVQLTNKTLPIGEYIKPYTDKFEGTIELEGY